MNTLVALVVIASVAVSIDGQRFGGHSSFSRFGHAFVPAPVVPAAPAVAKTELDLEVERINDAQDNMKKIAELLDAMHAETALHQTFLEELERVDIPRLLATNDRQDTDLDDRKMRVDATFGRIDNDLTPALSALTAQRSANGAKFRDVTLPKYTANLHDNLARDRQTADLLDAVRAEKDKMEAVTENVFRQLEDEVEAEGQRLNSTRDQENRFKCESGQVTLKHDDRQAEYTFQADFEEVPEVIYGVCAYNFNVDPDSSDYGQPRPWACVAWPIPRATRCTWR